MKQDVLMPENNEAELLKFAEKLGFKEIIFLYTDLSKKPENVSSKKIKILTAGLVVNPKDADNAARNFDLVFGTAQRSLFESKKINYLINAEIDSKKDFLYQRRAGLDDVMCRTAKEKNKIVVFNVGLISGKEADNILYARMMQNAKMCRKYKVKTLVATFARSPLYMRAPKDLDGTARILKLM